MKVGSLVICPNGDSIENIYAQPYMKPLPASDEIIYTVRSFIQFGGDTGIRLEEVINDFSPQLNVEFAYRIEHFREIQPPMDLSELLEETLFQTA